MKIPGLDYTSPTLFTPKQQRILFFLPPAIAFALKTVAATCRAEIQGIPPRKAVQQSPERIIIAVWHESMGIGVCFHKNRGYHSLTSYSFDGELAARVVRHFDIWALRGSSSLGGSKALAQLETAAEQATIGITVDGPRGPRRVAKPGVAILAARTQLPIVPHAYGASRAWRMHSWDRFAVPKPFCRILGMRGEPIPPPPDDSPEAIEVTRQRVEQELNALDARLAAALGIPAED